MLPRDDPGWRRAFGWESFALGLMIPIQERRAATKGVHGIVFFRMMFVQHLGALVAIGSVVRVLEATGGVAPENPIPSTPAAIGVAFFGLFSLVALRLIERPLDCAGDTQLAGAFRTRFFLRLAMASSTALIGFVGSVITGRWWLYLLGVGFALLGYVRLAPTRAGLVRDQEVLVAQGCPRSLVAALATLPPPEPRQRLPWVKGKQ